MMLQSETSFNIACLARVVATLLYILLGLKAICAPFLTSGTQLI